jgi:hypothetical protein
VKILQDLKRIPLVIKDGKIVADRRPVGVPVGAARS